MTEVLNKNTKKFLVEMSKKELKYYPHYYINHYKKRGNSKHFELLILTAVMQRMNYIGG